MIDSVDLTELSSEVFRSLLMDFIEQRLQTKDFEVNINSAAKKGDNFVGVVQRVSFNKNSSNVKSFVIFKTAPTNEARREQFQSRKYFLREIQAYNEVLPFFKEFQQLKCVNVKQNGFSEFPECYGSHDVEPNECLFLEDLTTSGFSMIDRHNETITAEHVNLVMKSLGKLHAISFALRDQQPEKFKEIVSPLTDLFTNDESGLLKTYWDKTKDCVLGCVSSDKDSFLLERLNKLYEKSNFEIAVECVNSDLAEPYAVICHGDCWTNNTMFKYDETKKPTQVCLVDWQLLRYCTPVTDLVYYIFLCTTKELRDLHYDTFLKTYHESLSSHLRSLGSEPEKLFPYEALLDQLHKFGRFGLVMALMLLPMITSDEHETPNLDELAENLKNNVGMDENIFITNQNKDIFNKRLRDIVVDMVQLNYF